MALVTKMNRCAVCGSSQISLMADGKYYHCEACGATSNHTMPAADLAKVDRISLMGGSTEEISTVDLLSAITNNSANRCAGYSAK